MSNTTETTDAISAFSHFDASGQAHMVDVSQKEITHRRAIAEGQIVMAPTTLAMIEAGNHKKGDVLGVARIAAIQAAKKTSDLIPLCHPLPLTRVAVEFECDLSLPGIRCAATVETVNRTGVEMEALTAVSIGLLTIYDMCKAVDKGMILNDISLTQKTGGRTSL